jgi:hypothetical protein
MLSALIAMFAPMAAGAQLIVMLVMLKGEICPGQRGRIHRILPVLVGFWLIAATQPHRLYLLLIAGSTLYFYAQVNTGKTREKGPLWAMYTASGVALVSILQEIYLAPDWIAAVFMLLSCVLLGAAAAHGLLTLAKTRLQAFHRLLPVIGIAAAMLLALCMLPFASQMTSLALHEVLPQVLTCFMLLVAAAILWIGHLLLSKTTVHQLQVTIVGLALLFSTAGFHQLYFVT